MYPYEGNDEELISLTCERHIANVGEQEFAVWNWLDLLAHREQPAIHTILKIFHGHGFSLVFHATNRRLQSRMQTHFYREPQTLF